MSGSQGRSNPRAAFIETVLTSWCDEPMNMTFPETPQTPVRFMLAVNTTFPEIFKGRLCV
jgi:hypothetical protein